MPTWNPRWHPSLCTLRMERRKSFLLYRLVQHRRRPEILSEHATKRRGVTGLKKKWMNECTPKALIKIARSTRDASSPHSRRHTPSVTSAALRSYLQSTSDQLTSSSRYLIHPLTANESDIIATDGLMFISYSPRAVLDRWSRTPGHLLDIQGENDR